MADDPIFIFSGLAGFASQSAIGILELPALVDPYYTCFHEAAHWALGHSKNNSISEIK